MVDASAGKHTRLILAEAWKRTTDSVLHDLAVAFIPAAMITALLYLDVVGRKLAVAAYQSWLILVMGIALWAIFVFMWNVAQGIHAVWKSDQEVLARQEQQIIALGEKMKPSFTVVCDENWRVSGDQKWCWVVFRVHNTSMEAAHGCFVKVVSFVVTFSVETVGVRAAPGAKFKWSNTNDPTCLIPSNSHEYVNIAFRHADTPGQWALHTDTIFPMPAGTFELAIEACGDNATSQTTKWLICYKRDELFRVQQIT